MPARDEGAAALLRGKRWRSLFRRIFYREDPFEMLDRAELSAVFDAFRCVVRRHPVVLYWVHRLNDDEYLVSSFHHRSMMGYSGMEVVHVTPDDIGYYRLPGAKAGGRGRVEPGVYPIAIQSTGRAKHYVRIRKCQFHELHLDEIGAPPVKDAGSFLPLPRHALDRSKFADEMRTIVERGLEWDYQRALLGEPGPIGEEFIEVAEKCAGISRKADALLNELCARTSPRSVTP